MGAQRRAASVRMIKTARKLSSFDVLCSVEGFVYNIFYFIYNGGYRH